MMALGARSAHVMLATPDEQTPNGSTVASLACGRNAMAQTHWEESGKPFVVA
jgi:hypothetical protein